jgi:hypothetical protein
MAVGLSGFFAGIAFLLACGEMDARLDAGSDAMADISPARVYHVENRITSGAGVADDLGRLSIAECNAGDVLLGGGCWIYRPDSGVFTQVYDFKHALVASGPVPAPPMGQPSNNRNEYSCLYSNRFNEAPDMIVVATAICYDVQP